MALTKPTIGSIGWGNSVNQNWTDIEGAFKGLCQGRLTLTSGIPVTTSDVTAAGSVYFTPYNGDQIALYDGSQWAMYTFAELTNTLSDTSKNPSAVANGSVYDLFVWNDSGTLRASRGPAWSSTTSRGTGAGSTELQLINGIWANKQSITNGPAANCGRYVGTIYGTGTNQTEDSAAGRLIWNAYNREMRFLRVTDSTDNWNYSTATWRQARGSTSNQVTMVVGLAGQAVNLTAMHHTSSTVFYNPHTGIGYDSTTAPTTGSLIPMQSGATSAYQVSIASLVHCPGIGYHYYAWLEKGFGSGTQTWYGDLGMPADCQSGIHGIWMS